MSDLEMEVLELRAEVAQLRLENARLRASIDGVFDQVPGIPPRPGLGYTEVEVVRDPVNPVQVWPVNPNEAAALEPDRQAFLTGMSAEVPASALGTSVTTVQWSGADTGGPAPIPVVLTDEERAADQAVLAPLGVVEVEPDLTPEASLSLRPPLR